MAYTYHNGGGSSRAKGAWAKRRPRASGTVSSPITGNSPAPSHAGAATQPITRTVHRFFLQSSTITCLDIRAARRIFVGLALKARSISAQGSILGKPASLARAPCKGAVRGSYSRPCRAGWDYATVFPGRCLGLICPHAVGVQNVQTPDNTRATPWAGMNQVFGPRATDVIGLRNERGGRCAKCPNFRGRHPACPTIRPVEDCIVRASPRSLS